MGESKKAEVVTPNVNPLLEQSLGMTVEQDDNVKSVSKELFSGTGIDLRTQVTHDEINMITKLRFLEERFKLENIDSLLGSFLNLRVSMDRKSREEFIRALNTENDQESGKSLLKRLTGG